MKRALLVVLVACHDPRRQPAIEITTSLPGASADTIASTITTVLERQLGQLPEIESLDSVSTLGESRIRVGLTKSTDLEAAALDVQAAINAASALLPRALPVPPTYATKGELVGRYLLPHGAMIHVDRLAQIAGVGWIDDCGDPPGERWLVADPVAVAAAGFTIDDLVSGLRAVKDLLPETVVGYRNGAPIRVSEVVTDAGAPPPICGERDATGSHLAITVYGQPGADLAAVRERLAAVIAQLRATGDLGSEVVALPELRELLVDGTATLDAVHRAIPACLVEQRTDRAWPVPVHADCPEGGDPIAALRRVPGVTSVGAPTAIVTISGEDWVALAAAAKAIPAIATEGLATEPIIHATVDRDAAARLGVTAQTIDLALAALGGVTVTTVYTQSEMTRVMLRVSGRTALSVRSASGAAVPLDALAKFETVTTPIAIVHAGRFPVVRLYTTGGDLPDMPPGVHASVVPYR